MNRIKTCIHALGCFSCATLFSILAVVFISDCGERRQTTSKDLKKYPHLSPFIVGMVLFSGCIVRETDRIMHLSYSSSQYGVSVESERNDAISVSTVVEQNRHGNIKALSFYSEDCILVCKVTGIVPFDTIRCQRISLNYCWQESFLTDLQVNANVIFLFARDGSFRGLIIPSVRTPDPSIEESHL